MAAVPSTGRATRIEAPTPLEADLTRALYEEYANQIFRYCLHQLGSREEAEDAVQSTFLNAFRGIKRGIVPELESAWLFKIAHNVCLSRRRSTWRRRRVESPADFEVVEELTPAPSRRADELIGLQDVLEQMPESQRRAILLREWQGLSYREIADELELSQAAVETLIFRARRALAVGLEQPPERVPAAVSTPVAAPPMQDAAVAPVDAPAAAPVEAAAEQQQPIPAPSAPAAPVAPNLSLVKTDVQPISQTGGAASSRVQPLPVERPGYSIESPDAAPTQDAAAGAAVTGLAPVQQQPVQATVCRHVS